MSISKIVVSGRVVRQPEKRFTPNTNVAVTEFAIAVESPAKADGTVETQTVKVVTWRELAERCATQIKKGDLVAVDGRIQISNYTNTEGQKRRDAEIDASYVENLSQTTSQGNSEGDFAHAASKTSARAKTTQKEDIDAIFANEDEIPF